MFIFGWVCVNESVVRLHIRPLMHACFRAYTLRYVYTGGANHMFCASVHVHVQMQKI